MICVACSTILSGSQDIKPSILCGHLLMKVASVIWGQLGCRLPGHLSTRVPACYSTFSPLLFFFFFLKLINIFILFYSIFHAQLWGLNHLKLKVWKYEKKKRKKKSVGSWKGRKQSLQMRQIAMMTVSVSHYIFRKTHILSENTHRLAGWSSWRAGMMPDRAQDSGRCLVAGWFHISLASPPVVFLYYAACSQMQNLLYLRQ